ncbi:putative aspartic peptidase domain-containing protein [Rosa chinensis]|uniref:Putative aspartic peptidase domain-containing protein n=1 Tax=Rosa chinensis TaxID=74649 RepID=A0A2P6RQL6_ROSCH|nr:putative aspartic peptidase domain-containing protein [Rosa chinensis]
MMALDTGSDLFWVSCEGTAYAPNFEVSKYDPKGSSTSKKVHCSVINVWEHSTLALIGSLMSLIKLLLLGYW